MEPGFNTIHCKDCIDGLLGLNPGSVDLAFADPPFNIGYEYDVYDDNRDGDKYLQWTRKWLGAVCQALKPTGTLWVAIGDEYAAEIKMIAQKELGLVSRSWVIWYYTFGVNCTKKFNRSHAHLFYFVKDAKQFTFNDQSIRVPSARQLVYADGRANPSGRLPDDTWILRPQDVSNGFGSDQDTWYFPRVAGTFKERAGFHGCQMPEQLLGRIIRCCSNVGDLVLDPFAGSGTTLSVANKLGRRWIGFEISESYAKRALERIGNTFEGEPLEGAPEPVVSAPRTPRVDGNELKDIDKSFASGLFALAGFGDPQERADCERAIIAAFLVASKGFSTERVIADPDLNGSFLNQCRKFGIPGESVTWNRALMGLRKAAKLASLPCARRTTFPLEEVDCYIFASEIAIRKMLDKGSASLDDILCDPSQASQFDEIARAFAPGFSSLRYRWAALKIRKRAHDIRGGYQASIPRELLQRRLSRFEPMNEIQTEQVKAKSGVYLLRAAPHRHLYAGATHDLGARLRQTLENSEPWRKISREIQVSLIPFLEANQPQRLGFQSNLIKQHEPDLNYLKLGVA